MTYITDDRCEDCGAILGVYEEVITPSGAYVNVCPDCAVKLSALLNIPPEKRTLLVMEGKA